LLLLVLLACMIGGAAAHPDPLRRADRLGEAMAAADVSP
jgi:hypothetical protein